MKKLANLKGVNVLSNKQKQMINGGEPWECAYTFEKGHIFYLVEPTFEEALANCSSNASCVGCGPLEDPKQ